MDVTESEHVAHCERGMDGKGSDPSEGWNRPFNAVAENFHEVDDTNGTCCGLGMALP
jgi:hypothetical protein